MLAALLNVPDTEEDWSIWSYNNYDCVNQIRQAILAQKGIQLPEYQIEPISFSDINTWLENNQQAHVDFTNALGISSVDLTDTDLRDPQQRQSWIYLNFQELNSACQTLKIGP
jgi:hypothetical protein